MVSVTPVELLKRAVLAAANGPFFPDWEFGTLFGLSRTEVAGAVADLADSASTSGELGVVAASAAVNNLTGYPHGQDALLEQWLAAPRGELEAAFRTWCGENGG